MNTATMLALLAVLDASLLARWLYLGRWRRDERTERSHTCLRCYTTGRPAIQDRGSKGIALAIRAASTAVCGQIYAVAATHPRFDAVRAAALVLVAAWPFLVYQVWRACARNAVCVECGHTELIPCETPRAQGLRLRAWADRRSYDRGTG